MEEIVRLPRGEHLQRLVAALGCVILDQLNSLFDQPRLFRGGQLRPVVRNGVRKMLPYVIHKQVYALRYGPRDFLGIQSLPEASKKPDTN